MFALNRCSSWPALSCLASGALLVLAGCSRGGSSGPSNAPFLSFAAPSGTVVIDPGDPVEIRYTDNDRNDEALTDIVAIDPGGQEVLIAEDRPEMDGVEQVLSWDTTGINDGIYRIVGRITGGNQMKEVQADTQVLVGNVGQLPPGVAFTVNGSGYCELVATAGFDNGGFVTTGVFDGPLVSGGITVPNNSSLERLFLARYNPDGSVAWVKTTSGTRAKGWAVDAYPDGSCLVLGSYSTDVQWAVGDPGAYTDTLSNGSPRAFVSRVDVNGMVEWTQPIKSTVRTLGFAVTNEPNGSFVVTGHFLGSLTLGEGQANETTIASVDDSFADDMFIAHYNGDGTLNWAQRGSNSTHIVHGYGVALLKDGAVAVYGAFRENMTLAHGTPEQVTLISPTTSSFLALYEQDGTLAWVRKVAPGGVFGYCVKELADGLLALGLDAEGEITLHEGEADEITFSGFEESAMIISLYQGDGVRVNSWAIDGAEESGGFDGMEATDDGGLVVATTVYSNSGQMTYNTEEGSTQVMSEGMGVFRFSPSGSLLWARAINCDDYTYAGNVDVQPDGTIVVGGSFWGNLTVNFGPGFSPLSFNQNGDEDGIIAFFDDPQLQGPN